MSDDIMRRLLDDDNGGEPKEERDVLSDFEIVLDLLDECEDELNDYQLGLCHVARMAVYELYRLLREDSGR